MYLLFLRIRSDGCAVSFEGKIYAIGGFDGLYPLKSLLYKIITYCKLSLLIGEIIHDSVEIYDPMQNQWKTGPTLNTVNQIHINY